MKIIGGTIARANSWPSTVYILFSYATNYYIPFYNVTTYQSYYANCAGTLIDRTTVVTAAHCLPESFKFKYKGITFTSKIEFSSFYPTLESMFTVYLGSQDLNRINVAPAVKMNVSKVILVSYFEL